MNIFINCKLKIRTHIRTHKTHIEFNMCVILYLIFYKETIFMITLNDVRITSTIHILYLINLYNYIIFIYYNDIFMIIFIKGRLVYIIIIFIYCNNYYNNYIHDNLYKRQTLLKYHTFHGIKTMRTDQSTQPIIRLTCKADSSGTGCPGRSLRRGSRRPDTTASVLRRWSRGSSSCTRRGP